MGPTIRLKQTLNPAQLCSCTRKLIITIVAMMMMMVSFGEGFANSLAEECNGGPDFEAWCFATR
jgi:hypothetical protein